MKKNILITISVVLLIFCACNNRSAKVEEIQEEVIEVENSVDYQIPDSAFNQTTAQSIDKVLSDSYKRYYWNGGSCYYEDDIYALAFEKLLTHYLLLPVTLNNTLDTLATLITIRQSQDEKIKFYIWRRFGYRNSFRSFVQFQGIKNTVLYNSLGYYDDEGFFSESEISEVYKIVEEKNTYYLAIGWGCYGSGLDIDEAYLFKIDGDSLIECKAFNGETSLSILYPYSNEQNIKYNDVTKTLSFEEFNIDESEEDYSKYRASFGKKKLKFSNGKFQ